MTLFGAPPPMDPSDVAVAAGGFWSRLSCW